MPPMCFAIHAASKSVLQRRAARLPELLGGCVDHLAEGGVGVDCGSQLGDGELLLDGQGQFPNEVCGTGADELCAQETVGQT